MKAGRGDTEKGGHGDTGYGHGEGETRRHRDVSRNEFGFRGVECPPATHPRVSVSPLLRVAFRVPLLRVAFRVSISPRRFSSFRRALFD